MLPAKKLQADSHAAVRREAEENGVGQAETKIAEIEPRLEAGSEPAEETGAGAAGSGEVEPGSGEPGALTAGGAEHGAIGEGGGGAVAEGAARVPEIDNSVLGTQHAVDNPNSLFAEIPGLRRDHSQGRLGGDESAAEAAPAPEAKVAPKMKYASLAVALLGLGAAGIAAWYWYGVSKVPVVPTWMQHGTPFEPVIKEQSQDGWIGGLLEATGETARLNRLGAIWTGISTVLGAIAAILGSLPISN